MAVENFTLELDREAVETIRHALLIGLSCHADLTCRISSDHLFLENGLRFRG